MAKSILPGVVTTVDTAKTVALGTRARLANGNEYIYLQGIGSTAANDLVTFSTATYLTTRALADGVGPCAIAQAAVVANDFGWYLVCGAGTINTNGTVASGAGLFLTAGAGAVDDAGVAGDWVQGLISRSAVTGAGTVSVDVNFPMVYNNAYLT